MSEKQQPKRRGPMHGGPAAMRPAEKAKDFKGTFKKLMAYLRAYWLPLVLMIVFAVASTVFTIVGPKILGSATNKLVEGISGQMMYDKIQSQLPEGVVLPEGTKGEAVLPAMPDEAKEQLSQSQLETLSQMDISKRPEIDFSGIGHILIWLMGLYALSALFQYIQGYITTGISQKVAYRLRRDISQKINRMPLKYFDRTSHGDVLSRITNDVDTVSQSLNQSISQLVSAGTTLVGILVMMISISLPMTLVALLVLPLSLLVVKSVVKRSQKNFVDQQNALGALNGHVEEMYGGHLVMKAFNGEQASLKQFKKVNDELYENARKAQFLSGLMMPILNFISNLGYVGVCVLGGYLANGKLVEIGDIQAFIQYVRNFNQPITQTANMANLLQSTMAAAERVFVFLEEEEEVPESKTPKTIDHVRGAVEFDHVAFGYRADKQVIKDFTANIRPEQKVAIVGPGRRQNHHGKPLDALLRCGQRRHPRGRRGHKANAPGGIARAVWHGIAGYLAVFRHDPGKHRIRQTGRHRRRDAKRGQGSACGSFCAHALRGLRYRAQRRCVEHFPGPAPAFDHRPRAFGRPADPHFGRSHKLGRHPHGGAHSAGHGQSDERAHQLYHRAPAFHHPRCRFDLGYERGQHHRAGHPRAAACAKRLLRRTV